MGCFFFSKFVTLSGPKRILHSLLKLTMNTSELMLEFLVSAGQVNVYRLRLLVEQGFDAH